MRELPYTGCASTSASSSVGAAASSARTGDDSSSVSAAASTHHASGAIGPVRFGETLRSMPGRLSPPPGRGRRNRAASRGYFFAASSARIQPTSFFASACWMATAFGGIARPLTLPFQWLS